MKKIFLLLSLLPLLLSTGCTSGEGSGQHSRVEGGIDTLDFTHIVHFDHARGLSVTNEEGYKEVVVFAPDSPDTLAVYILYPRGHRPELNTVPAQARFIPVPARTLGCISTTEIGALPLLGLRDRLVACGDVRNISDSILRQYVSEGKIADIGLGMSRNVEQILSVRPEILIQTFTDASAKDEDLTASGVEIVLFNGWKEQTLLARAEWLKMLGMLFGRNRQAEQTFHVIEQEYRQAQALLGGDRQSIPILYGQDYKGQWYVPGEYSYVTAMLHDAGLRYDYVPNQVASQPMSFEYVFSRHRHSKIWLSSVAGGVRTLEDFIGANERYAHFDATQTGSVWVDNKRINEYGGNDIWESGPYQPHLILKDLIKIAHPDLLPEYETTYWQELKR